jgi:hypothetical protein
LHYIVVNQVFHERTTPRFIRVPPFSSSMGVYPLRDRKCLYHGLRLWRKCLQVYDYKDSFNSSSSMLSNQTRSNLQVLLKLDSHKVSESQACLQSLELLLWEFVFSLPPLWSPWTLNWWERIPIQFPLEVKRAFFFL